MPITELPQSDIFAPLGSERPFAATPGQMDVDHGSDSPVEKPSWWALTTAAFRNDNTVGSYSASETRNSPTYQEEDFHPWESIKDTKYEAYPKRFADVRNTRASDDLKRQIDREEQDQKTLDAVPWYQSLPLHLVAGGLDLPSLIPGGAFVRSAQGGISIGRTALNVSLAAGVSSLAQETALQQSQATRPLSESATNIGASVFLGGLLGAGGAKLLSRGEWFRGQRDINRGVTLGTHVPGTPVEASLLAEGGVSGQTLADHFPGFEAYHGSPHDFESFDLSKIGTGEGAQAYGHGIYAAENPGVAADYRRRLAPGDDSRVRPDEQATAAHIAQWDQLVEERRAAAGPDLRGDTSSIDAKMDALHQRMIDETVERSPWLKEGVLYKVRINADKEHFLDWDKPLSEQSPKIREFVKGRVDLLDTASGEEIYRALTPGFVSSGPYKEPLHAEASNVLREAGIPGIKYLDAGSRDAAEGTRNFVVFDDKLIQITDKNGKPVLTSSGTGAGLSSAGAAANLPRGIEANTIAGKAAQSLAAATGQLNPIMRALRSPSAAWREISQQLFETPIYLKKNFENIASDVAAETLMKEWNGGLAKAVIATKDAFEAYKKAGGELARDEFRQAVGKAMRRGDASDDPHVAQVAKEWRAKVFDPLKDAAIKAGLLPEDVDVKTAASYFSRMWNRNKLIAREGEFKQIVRDWVQGQYQTWEKSFEAETRNKSAALEAEKRAAFEAERAAKQETLFENPKESAHDIANQVFNTLTGKSGDPSVRPEFITIKARGPLKERTFNIPDQLVEDFLEHDVEMVGRRYTRIMGADVELANKFEGSPDMADQIAKVHEDYAQLRNGITDEKQLTKLGNREKADIRDLEAVRDLLRGTGTFYNRAVEGNFNRIVNGANQFNYIRQMGEVVLASLTDVIRPAMVHGLMPYMGGLVQLATNMKGIRLSVAEAQLAGNVLERTLAHRMATIAEIIDPYSAKTPVEAMLRNLSEVGSRWNGIRLWTDGMKSFSSVLTQNRILKGVESFAGLKDKEKAYLAFLGIDESMAGRVAKEFAEHGETVEGVRVANTEKWDDPVVRRAYRAAINKDVDSIIVQKGVGDTPLMANTPVGRAVLQFKSFALASHQRVLMRGLQEDQARLVGSIVAMTTMGMMMTWLKAISGNRKEDLEYMFKNPGWTIAEGLDRSGVLSVPVEAANAFEKITHFNPIKTPMKAFDEGSAMSQKLQNRNEAGAALGPSFGLLQDIGTAVGIPKTMAQGEELTQGQKGSAQRLLPFQTYAGIRSFLSYIVNPPN